MGLAQSMDPVTTSNLSFALLLAPFEQQTADSMSREARLANKIRCSEGVCPRHAVLFLFFICWLDMVRSFLVHTSFRVSVAARTASVIPQTANLHFPVLQQLSSPWDEIPEGLPPLQQALAQRQRDAEVDFIENQAPKWLGDYSALPFSCTECGRCCQTTGHVYMSPTETGRAARELGVSADEFIRTYASHTLVDATAGLEWIRLRDQRDEGLSPTPACVFLDLQTNHCRIYEVRPTQCRTYPFWPKLLQNPANWDAECRPVNDPAWHPDAGGCEGMTRLPGLADRDGLDEKSELASTPMQEVYHKLHGYVQEERRFPSGSKEVPVARVDPPSS